MIDPAGPLVKMSLSFMYIVAGVLIRKFGFCSPKHARQSLRAAIWVTLPACLLLEFNATADLTIGAKLAGVVLAYNAAMLAIGLWVFRNRRGPERAPMIAMLLGWNIANFAHPFVAALWGAEALRSAIAIDVANCVVTFVLAYVVFQCARSTAGGSALPAGHVVRRLLTFPPLVAVYASLALRAVGASLPGAVTAVLAPVAKMNAPIILIALGVLFELRSQPRQATTLTSVLSLRYGIGLLTGAALVTWLPAHLFPYPAPLVLLIVLACPVPAVYIDYATVGRCGASTVSMAVNCSNVASFALVVLFAALPFKLVPLVAACVGAVVLTLGMPALFAREKVAELPPTALPPPGIMVKGTDGSSSLLPPPVPAVADPVPVSAVPKAEPAPPPPPPPPPPSAARTAPPQAALSSRRASVRRRAPGLSVRGGVRLGPSSRVPRLFV